MFTCAAIIAALAIGGTPTPMEKNDAVYKEAVKIVNELCEVLKPVKDKASAESASAKLTRFNQRLAELAKKETRLSPEDENALFAKHKTSVDAAIQSYDTEILRLHKIPKANGVLEQELSQFVTTHCMMRMTNLAMKSKARVQISQIDKAIQAFKLKTGKLPDSLNELTESGNVFLNEKGLRDPWDRVFLYDATGARNRGRIPDVWTQTPEREVIGNWEK